MHETSGACSWIMRLDLARPLVRQGIRHCNKSHTVNSHRMSTLSYLRLLPTYAGYISAAERSDLHIRHSGVDT